MDIEAENTLIARLAALERVVTLLLSDRLQRLPEGDVFVLKGAISADVPPPPMPDIDLADANAGRAIAYQEAIGRILRTAQEIANLREG